MHLGQRLLFYSMVGVFNEIVFTSLKTVYYHKNFMLHGNTQLWVILLYISGGLLFEKVYKAVPNVYKRINIYILLIYAIEYSGGWILHQILGECPWEYKEYGNVHGFIQLSYTPFWGFFAIVANYCVYISLHFELVHRNELIGIIQN